MPTAEQLKRFGEEHEVMRGLDAQSSVFEFEPRGGNPPKEYKVILRGKGVSSRPSPNQEVELSDVHELEIRLGFAFPERPPEVRCKTSIFHPNISSVGFIKLDECGLEWEPEMTLDVVIERLWDVIRGAFINKDKASNYSAQKWFAEQNKITFPVDQRPLRDRSAPAADNVVQYERGPAGSAPPSSDVLYISDDTPTPVLPRKKKDDDDVLYIK
jgi:hypothetical protein